MSYKIDVEKISEDQGLQLSQVEGKDSLGIDHPECTLIRDIELTGTLTRLGREVFFKGLVESALKFSCSRCLEEFETPVSVPVSTCFMPIPANEPPEESELRASDIEVEYYRENTIDLAQPVFDQILLTQPLIPLCRPDCLGLCAQCGANRNLESCQCEETETVKDPRLAVLQKLKENIK